MAAPEKVDQSRLEEALMRWNRGADAAYPELEELFEQARRDLRRLSTVLSESRAIPARLAITSGAGTPESQAAAVERLEGMEETLAAFHVELQTLLAQLRRTIQSGRDLAADLAALRQEEVPALTGLDALEQYEFGQQPGRSSQEEELEAQVKTLENALGAVRNRLLEAESRVKDAATIPNEVQEELINLRHEVAELRANRDITQALLTPEQEKQLEESIRAQAYDEAGKRRPMGLILVNAGVITREQLEAALREQQSAWNRHLGAILVELGFVSEETIAQTLAAQAKLPYVRLAQEEVTGHALGLIPAQLAHYHTSVPLRVENGRLLVAMANPMDLVALEDLRLAADRDIEPVVASASEVASAIQRFYD